VTPELAAKIEAARCKATDGQPVHLTKDMVVELLETKGRVADALRFLRQYMDLGPDVATVPAREVWNRLCTRYFDPHEHDPDEEAQV
jgi:hypothetical protein